MKSPLRICRYSCRWNWANERELPFLIRSCHSDVTCRARSRAVRTRCTSSPSSSAIARATCSSVAAPSTSWLRMVVPGCSLGLATHRAPPSRQLLGRVPPELVGVAQFDGRQEHVPLAVARQAEPLCLQVVVVVPQDLWRNVVPLLGVPTCRTTRRGALPNGASFIAETGWRPILGSDTVRPPY